MLATSYNYYDYYYDDYCCCYLVTQKPQLSLLRLLFIGPLSAIPTTAARDCCFDIYFIPTAATQYGSCSEDFASFHGRGACTNSVDAHGSLQAACNMQQSDMVLGLASPSRVPGPGTILLPR